MKAFVRKAKIPRDPFFGIFPHLEDDKFRPKIESTGVPENPGYEENVWAVTVRRLEYQKRSWR